MAYFNFKGLKDKDVFKAGFRNSYKQSQFEYTKLMFLWQTD